MVKLRIGNAAASIKAREAEKAPLSEHKILIVDDEEPNLRNLAAALSDKYPVKTHLDAREALKEIDSGETYDVIVSDYRMPEMNGVDFFKALKQRHHTAPRIMVTGFAALDNVIAAINECSVFQYVTKPIDVDSFKKSIDDAVSHKEMRDENGRLMTLVKELLESNAELAKDNEALGGAKASERMAESNKPRKSDLCVLFADVRGFTKVVREHDPEAVISALQQLFKPMHDIVYDAGGIIDKHLGDGLMAVFGLSGQTTASAALAAVREMVPATAQTLETLPEPFNQLRVSFGLAAGEVVVGMLGSQRRAELAVIGEPANLAARLQEFSKIALTDSDEGKALGAFERVMCLYDPTSFPEGEQGADLINLTDARVRDFGDLKSLAVLRA